MTTLSDDEILSYAAGHIEGFEPDGRPVKLSGGNLNYVWRLSGKKRNIILKLAPPYIASNPDMPLHPSRIHFEANALTYLGKKRSSDSGNLKLVHIPEIFYFNPQKNLLLMEDIGTGPALFTGLNSAGHAKVTAVKLGRFFGTLHTETYRDKNLGRDFHNIKIQKTRLEIQYLRADEYLLKAGFDSRGRAAKNAERLGRELLKPGKCLVMGDLWPPSVIHMDVNEISLIDWEFCHFGRPLQDIAHLAAHCRMHEIAAESSGKKEIVRKFSHHFFKSYINVLGSGYPELITREEKTGFNIHYAMEILARTTGPFKSGYLFDSLDFSDTLIKQLTKEAFGYLTSPENENPWLQ